MCDEPISALDVSIQAQIVNLLMDLQREMNLTYFFIAHDLSMVKHISDNIAVMYMGKIVEFASSSALYQNPLHPYTKALLSAIPIADPDMCRDRERIRLEGEVPSPIDPAPGCFFKGRCKYALSLCAEADPVFNEIESGHFAACHLLNK